MVRIALKHKTYIVKAWETKTANNGLINRELINAYVDNTGDKQATRCPKCIGSKVIPYFYKLLIKQ